MTHMKDKEHDWKATTIAHIRKLMKQVDPKIVEEVKWRKPSNPSGVPVWSYQGIICTGETYGDKVKLTFMKGSILADNTNLFNAGNGSRRAIDIHEDDELNEIAFMELVKEAIKLNIASSK